MKARLALQTLAALGALSSSAYATTRQVGPARMYTSLGAASSAAQDGDVIEVDAGTYHEAVTWRANQLTVRGVGGRPVLDMTGMTIDNGKAIFVTAGADVTLENLEFVGAAVPDQNGAGVRWEGGGSLTVRGCVFRSNENGILGGNVGNLHPENTATVEFSEFVDNGRGRVGYTHSVYFGEADTVTFRGNWSHALWPGGSDIGHLFKSRAHRNFVLYNRFTAENNASSYELNLPEGGEAYVIGNLLQQRMGGQRTMLSFGDGDGTQYTGSRLYAVNNTFVNEASGDATFVRTTQADAELHLSNNLFVGAGTVSSGGVPTTAGNLSTASPGFVDQAGFDYHLTASSPAVNAGGAPGSAGAMSLVPVFEYLQPTALSARVAVGAIDVGAYELGGTNADTGPAADSAVPDAATVSDASAGTDASTVSDARITLADGAVVTSDAASGDGGSATPAQGACGCRTAGGSGSTRGQWWAALVLAGALAGRRRRAV